jgi:peptide/nickel transport system ATP-binding protein
VVESGPASVVTDEPAHPYTQLLLSAAPDPDRAEPPSLQGRGSPPSLVAPPSGCRFHPRCPHAMAVCAARTPPPTEVAAGHSSACWLHASGLTTAARWPSGSPAGQHRPTDKDPDTVAHNRPASSRPGTTEFKQ